MQTHKIKSIKKLKVPLQPVYDITTSYNHNFILQNDAIVHNCDFGQILQSKGYNYSVLSVDRVDPQAKICKPYQFFRTTIYDKKLEIYNSNKLISEITDLERNIDTGKVDHPDGGCFTGETQVQLVDGRSLSFLDLVKEFNEGKENYVYSVNLDTKTIEPKKILKAWKTLENQPLVKLTFDNDESVECTLNHKFMLRNGEYVEAQYLTLSNSLMSLNSIVNIKAIEFINKRADVYDIEVEDNHNFALTAGVFVHNSKDVCDAVCGAIYTASTHAEEFAFDYGETYEQVLRINQDSHQAEIEDLTSAMEDELKKLDPLHNKQKTIHPSDATALTKTTNYSMYNDIIIL